MKKINLKWKSSREFPWVISIIILLVATFIFYVLKEEEKRQKIFTQDQLVKAIRVTDNVATKLIGTIEDKKIVERKLATEKEKVASLETEIEEKDEQIRLTLDRLERETVARREAEAQLLIAIRGKRSLETELKKLTEATTPVELEKIVVKPALELAGKILMINEEHGFIVVDLGRVNDLEFGDLLSIYRNGEFIGRAEVEMVYEKRAAAAVLPDWKETKFMENDEVRKL